MHYAALKMFVKKISIVKITLLSSPYLGNRGSNWKEISQRSRINLE